MFDKSFSIDLRATVNECFFSEFGHFIVIKVNFEGLKVSLFLKLDNNFLILLETNQLIDGILLKNFQNLLIRQVSYSITTLDRHQALLIYINYLYQSLLLTKFSRPDKSSFHQSNLSLFQLRNLAIRVNSPQGFHASWTSKLDKSLRVSPTDMDSLEFKTLKSLPNMLFCEFFGKWFDTNGTFCHKRYNIKLNKYHLSYHI